jgi:glycosyltransferase involved in cell wall biosynthesis
MSNIKVLVVPSDRTGVGAFRSVNPHIALEDMYAEEFSVDIDYEPQLGNDEWLKQYDIIHYHRTLGAFETMPEILERTKRLGIVTIMDLDDYWAPGTHHPAYLIIKNNKLDEKILGNIKVAENVTTTTDLFADEIKKYNKNTFVLPNAIDPTTKQYISNPEKSDRIRIGWLGGSSHLEDLKLLNGLVGKLKSAGLLDKVQFVLCGYDLRGTITMIDQNTGQQTQRPIRPEESVWYQYEKIFTDNYSTVSPEYRDFLLKFKQEDFQGVENEPYRRVWTKPISTYATNYNLFDISLAPLEENIFNKVKSQLKVIESGFHKKAIIAQNFGPYKIDLVDANIKGSKNEPTTFNPEANAYLVDSVKNHKQWYDSIKKLINNPEQIEILATNLHNTVKNTYSITAVTEKRRELYLDLLKNAENSNYLRRNVVVTEKV